MTTAAWLVVLCITTTAQVPDGGAPNGIAPDGVVPDGVEFRITARELASVSYELRVEIAALQYLLNPFQLKYFFELPGDAARDKWIERFWKSKDPTPTTTDNPMRDLHNERAEFSRSNYGVADWPGWDDRGHMYIRYGPPDYRGRIASNINPHGVDLGVWLWYYEKHNMLTAFEYFEQSGPHHFATSHLGLAKFMTPQLIEFLIYDANPAYEGMIPINILTPEYVTRRGILGDGEGRDAGYTDVDRDHLEHLGRKMEYSTLEVLHDVPSSYPFSFAGEAFPFYFDVNQFKGGDELNRIEVNVEFLVGAKNDKNVATPPVKRYDVRAVFFDPDYSEVTRRESSIDIAGEAIAKGRRLWPAQLFTSLARDYYRVAVSVEEGGRSSSYWSNVMFKDFSGGLALSDVLFASRIGAAENNSPFNRGALEVVPHPARIYRQGEELPVYFELYNLRMENEQTSYEISYRIAPHTTRKGGYWNEGGGVPAIASSFNASGYNRDEPLYLVIRTENLKPGTYDFLISITDLVASDTVRRASAFKVVDEDFVLAN